MREFEKFCDARGWVKTHFSTVESACLFHQGFSYRKIDRYRICSNQLSHALAQDQTEILFELTGHGNVVVGRLKNRAGFTGNAAGGI